MTEKKIKYSFDTVEELYREKLMQLVRFAERHIFNRDHAIDLVHQTLSKVIEWKKRNPEKKVNEYIVKILILRESKKFNVQSAELPFGDVRDYLKHLEDN